MVDLATIVNYLDSELENKRYHDSAINGLQVEVSGFPVEKVALAVDSGLSIIEKAIESKSQLLIVHHGLFWHGLKAGIVGTLSKKIGLLFEGKCALYASHLPLDGNKAVGNGFELARYLALEDLKSHFEVDGMPIGVMAQCKSPTRLEDFVEKLARVAGATDPLVLPFGEKEVKMIAIVTGSGSSAIEEASRAGADLLISGEPKQEVYHQARELGINAIFFGHYASETFGVKAIGRALKSKFALDITFIHEGTGI
jgi:dinuclear metal center YbgI/SA1388 family protein